MWLVVLAVGLLLATVAAETMQGIAQDLHRGVGRLPRRVFEVVLVAVQVTYLLVLTVTPLVLLATRRFALVGRGALALVLGSAAFWLVERVPAVPAPPEQLEQAIDLTTVSWPPTAAPRRLHGARGGDHLDPAPPVAAGGVGAARRPGGPAGRHVRVRAARRGAGRGRRGRRRVGDPAHAGQDGRRADPGRGPTDARRGRAGARGRRGRRRGTWTFRGRTQAGPVVVRVIGEHDWSAARLDQAYRRLRWKDVGDDDLDPAHAVTTEAMTSFLAASRAVRVPAVRAVARAPRGEALLAVDVAPGRLLSSWDPTS